MTSLRDLLLVFIGITIVLCGFSACARMGSPQGGLYDVTPPRFVLSHPQPNTVNFKGNKVEMVFDELITIEKPMEKVIITPPQRQQPEISAIGKKINIILKDSLLPNTTYTFDFTNGVVDNNEKNVLEGYTFSFSTGGVIDSLVISGILLNAENLEPMPNITIGLHQNLHDSVFTTIPFIRTTRTNDVGRFWVRNVSAGSYRIFALNDLNRDYHFDQAAEDIAFYDDVVIPSFEPSMSRDTLWKDSLTIDTIKDVHYNRFLPDDIRLSLFKEKFERQYLSKTERIQPHTISFHFNATTKLPPELHFPDRKIGEDWAIPEYANEGKTIIYWIRDSLVYQADTIHLEVGYFASDSSNNLVPVKDTLTLSAKNKPVSKKGDKAKKEKEKFDFLEISVSNQSTVEIYDTLRLTFSEPIMQPDTNNIKLEQKIDTLWKACRLPFVRDSLNPRVYAVYPPWTYGGEYRLSIDSAAINSMYGKKNDKFMFSFKVPEESSYGNLYIAMTGITSKGFGELLDSSDKPVRKSSLSERELVFENVKPGKYYLRYTEDKNENGIWDSGNYKQKQQAEQVYYYPTFFELRQFFNIEQNWDVKSVSIEKQKPLEITKNKPEQKKQPKRNENVKTINSNKNASNTNNTRSPQQGRPPF